MNSSSFKEQNMSADDLTELKWLNKFQFKELKCHYSEGECLQNGQLYEDQISELCNELRNYKNESFNNRPISCAVLIFLAFYSKRKDKQTPWTLTTKQLYEYIKMRIKPVALKLAWKNTLKQTLVKMPCFIRTTCEMLRSRSVYTIDPYYRSLLTRAYSTRLSSNSNEQNKKIYFNRYNDRISQSVFVNFAPKSIRNGKVRRIYKRFGTRPISNETFINNMNQGQYDQNSDNHKQPCFSSSAMHLTKESDINPIVESMVPTPYPSIDHTYFNATEESSDSVSEKLISSTAINSKSRVHDVDECDNRPEIPAVESMSTKAQTLMKSDLIRRRKSASPKRCLPYTIWTCQC